MSSTKCRDRSSRPVGPDPERAVFYPRDEELLTDRDLTVRHYQVYGSSGLAG